MALRSAARRPATAVFLALALTACSQGTGVPGTTGVGGTAPSSTTTAPTTTTAPPPVLCEVTAFAPASAGDEVRSVSADDPAAAAVGFSKDTFECAADVVLVTPGDLEVVALAARLAAALGGPLLFEDAGAPEEVESEIARLIPQRVWLTGEATPLDLPEGSGIALVGGDPARVAAVIEEIAGGGEPLALPPGGGPDLVAVAVEAMVEGRGLAPAPTTTTTSPTSSSTTTTTGTTTSAGDASTTTTPDESAPAEEAGPLPTVTAGTGERGVAWLVDADAPDLALAAAAAAVASGNLMALVDGADLRRVPEVGRALRASGAGAIRLVGEVTDDASWQLPLLLEGDELPGGGYLMFPGRRLVALYGHSWAPELGVLAEQSPAAAVERVGPLAAQYAEDDLVVVPAFEIIATVADARAGSDGNYSNESPPDDIRPWIEAAGASGLYVLLDLQPGRSDFLSQAKLYEEFLRLPYVGLALDPEWRLGPNEFHLQQYGSVAVSEVNAVADWLAGLAREEHLPQKMLLLHQFRLSMIPDREDLAIPPELALVIQMDGQGALADKYATWEAVTAGTEDAGWFWGWKNFYDEDSPMATPAEVLALVPRVVYVSYQ